MEATVNRQSRMGMSDKTRRVLVDIICYLFVLLFVYTAASKITTINLFTDVLKRYPLIGEYNKVVAYLVPAIELAVALLLIVPTTKRLGLTASLILMATFLFYIIYMFASNTSLPCSCGGIISELSWEQHIWFNSIFLVLAVIGIKYSRK